MKNNYLKNEKANKHSLHFSAFILSMEASFLISLSAISQNFGINNNGGTPDASAILDIDANDKDLLIPRLTNAQRDAIQNPVMSLLIYNLQTECFEAWNSNISAWVAFGCLGCDSRVPVTTADAVESGTDVGCNGTSWRGTHTGEHLKTSTWGGDNTSGFSALPGGYYDGSYHDSGVYGNFWTATGNGGSAWRRVLSANNSASGRTSNVKASGFSVRCIKD